MQWIVRKKPVMSWLHVRSCILGSRTFPSRNYGLARAFSSKPHRCHYEVLGVKKNATAKEIRESFVSLSKKLHPDRNRSGESSHQKMVELNVAYTILAKPETRYAYDRTLNTTTRQNIQYPSAAQDVYQQSYTEFYEKMYKEREKERQRLEEEWKKAEQEFQEAASKFVLRCVILMPLVVAMPVMLLIFKGLVFGGQYGHTRHGRSHSCDTCIMIEKEISELKAAEAQQNSTKHQRDQSSQDAPLT